MRRVDFRTVHSTGAVEEFLATPPAPTVLVRMPLAPHRPNRRERRARAKPAKR